MITAPLPENEFERLSALASYHVLDTEPEVEFDDLTALAAQICNTPIALVSFIDAHRQWFKSRYGLAASETPREVAYCAHAILERRPMVVADALLDQRFYDNPLATAAPQVRFYAGAPLIDSDGNALGTLCVIDHVPRTLSDEQLTSLARLARQVMSQLHLRKACEAARSAVRAKSEFLANMSHEIRTPLNGVLGVAQLLSETPLSSEQREYVDIAKLSGEHLLTAITNVLDFSALETGSVQLNKSAFDLRIVVDEVIQMTAEAARRKGLTVNLQWPSVRSGQRIGDRYRIRQVLLNLVANAIKFTASGSVTIVVADTHTPSLLHISVIDTGIGIAPHTMPKLFAPFTQDDSSLNRRFGGSGLGLAIVRRLLELMGGQVHVTSELDKGSRFWCVIPLPLAQVEAACA